MKSKQMGSMSDSMSAKDLESLCSGRGSLLNYFPPTIFWPAEAYGFGKYIRKYGYYPRCLPLPIYTDHGVQYLNKRPYKHELESYAPVMFYHMPESVTIWKKWSSKPCYVLFSPFVYYRRSHHITPDKEAVGTIVFPDHTMPDMKEVSDTQEYIDQLKKLPDKFQPISVCLHFQDIRIGRHKIYIKNGLPIYTAGDNFEYFAERFYAILKRFKFASSNYVGSSLYYAVEMGIPFFIYGNKPINFNISNDNYSLGRDVYYNGCESFEKIENMFTNLDCEITAQKRKLVERSLGLVDGMSRGGMSWVLYSSLGKLLLRQAFYMDMFGRIKLSVNTILRKIGSWLFYNRILDYSKVSLREFTQRSAGMIKEGQKVLDVGAGECQYKSFFKHTTYVSQDLGIGDADWDFSQVDIVSEIYDIPVEDGSFDFILCTEVLEHLRYPDRAMKECNRILKAQGSMFVTCPMMWGERQIPHDYFRYTQYALRMLAEENGFTVKEIKPMGGRYLVMSEIIIQTYYVYLSAIGKRFSQPVAYLVQLALYPLVFATAFGLYWLDKTDTKKDLTLHYSCIFVKP